MGRVVELMGTQGKGLFDSDPQSGGKGILSVAE